MLGKRRKRKTLAARAAAVLERTVEAMKELAVSSAEELRDDTNAAITELRRKVAPIAKKKGVSLLALTRKAEKELRAVSRKTRKAMRGVVLGTAKKIDRKVKRIK